MQQILCDILPVFARSNKKALKRLKIQLIVNTENSYASRFRSPVGTAESNDKKTDLKSRFFVAFLPILAKKIGVKNSYAPQAPLVDIFQ